VSWTRRFGLTLGLCGLFFMLYAGWLGLLPDTLTNVGAAAAVLTSIGLYAARVSSLGIGLGLFVTIFIINADQATIALGIPVSRSGLAATYWFTNILPTALVWMSFPIVARLLARPLPATFSGLAIGIALLPLPALRYITRPDLFVDVYLHPRLGTFAILPMPWPTLVVLVTILATVAVVLLQRPGPTLRRVTVGVLVAATLLAPALDAVAGQARLRTSIDIQPSSGGPLTPVTVRASLATDEPALVLWDGRPVTTGAFLEALRPFVVAGATRAQLLPALQATDPGLHEVSIAAGTERRVGSYLLRPPAGLQVVLSDGHVVVSGGIPNAELDVLAVGDGGPELLHRRFDSAGAWRSPLTLTAAVGVQVIVQSGDAWGTLRVDGPSSRR
jgi:hypothetical protein